MTLNGEMSLILHYFTEFVYDVVVKQLRLICQRYLPCYLFFLFSLLFFHVGQPGSTATYSFTQYRTSDVAKNLGIYFSCTEHTSQRNNFELILTVKMETRHPVKGSFGIMNSGDL